MGIDAYILVTRQITDQAKWQEALAAVKKEFSGDPVVHDGLEDPEWCAEAQQWFQRRENVDLLELSEPLNFGMPHGTIANIWSWKSIDHKDLMDPNQSATKEGELKEACSGALKGLQDGECSQELVDLRKGQLANFRYFMNVYSNLDSLQQKLIEDEVANAKLNHDPSKHSRFCRNLDRLTFKIGEHPSLPIFGRHFTSCTSKITGRNAMGAEVVLAKVYKVLRKYFDEDLVFWIDYFEESGRKLPDLLKAPAESPDDRSRSRARFYETLRAAFAPEVDAKSESPVATFQRCLQRT